MVHQTDVTLTHHYFMAQIIPLSEGSFTIDATKEFIPFDINTDDLQQRTRGSLLVEIQPFLLITEKDYLLLDTGLGFHTPQENLQLHQNLINHGIDPSQITKVLISHLHKDHTGGISFKNEKTGKRALSFPEAVYYVNKDEMNYALQHDGKSYLSEEFSLLKESGNVSWLEGDGIIDGYIDYRVTGGHCPYHQVFWIQDRGDIYFFGGDVAPQFSQMKNRFIAKYDYDGRKSMELRQQYAEQGKKEKWTFLFYHDIKTPFIQLG
jgi:glyoxylase-like metal-dependent hydrolase (beta-lactamase superfamily II)